MSVKYITAAQADRMRREAVAIYDPYLRSFRGIVGVTTGVDYYVVPDGDPRLQSPDRISDTESPK